MAVRFDNNNNYPPITLPPLQTTVEIEEHRKNTTFDQKSGKIVGKKIILSLMLAINS
ncbi:hypothetical protein [Helicobacter pylori]|uniref:hypothetical protein n=1 Tax=Helicobacter pylori TaxID=210 RepID=UPI001FD440A2|nr:hypothetical protein [Helicobacter pylori]UOR75667.1 hypothetical protein MPG47_03790 [Helicobacter pylori]